MPDHEPLPGDLPHVARSRRQRSCGYPELDHDPRADEDRREVPDELLAGSR